MAAIAPVEVRLRELAKADFQMRYRMRWNDPRATQQFYVFEDGYRHGAAAMLIALQEFGVLKDAKR
jgi:hypothetical protein